MEEAIVNEGGWLLLPRNGMTLREFLDVLNPVIIILLVVAFVAVVVALGKIISHSIKNRKEFKEDAKRELSSPKNVLFIIGMVAFLAFLLSTFGIFGALTIIVRWVSLGIVSIIIAGSLLASILHRRKK